MPYEYRCGGLHYTKIVDGKVVHDHIHAFDPRSAGAEVEHADVLRFFNQGPQRFLIPLPAGSMRKSSDGVSVPVSHVLQMYLDPTVPPNTTREDLKTKIADVLQHSQGWVRAGVWMRFTENPSAYDTEHDIGRVCVVRVKPYGDTTCGGVHTSCAHTRLTSRTIGGQQWRTWTISVDLKLEHMDGSTIMEGAGGPNHEIGGHIAHGACDMYRFENQPGYASTYSGVMDSGSDFTPWPTDADIAEAQAKMRGEARYPTCGYPQQS